MNRSVKHSSLALALVLSAGAASGQANQGALTGIVRDSSGAAIPNVKVTVRNKQTSKVLEATADDTGHFRARLSNPTTSRWFDTSIFSAATAFTFGNVGPYLRDVTTQPIHNLDAVLSKSFILIPGDHLVTGTLRAEAYNATNSVQLGFPNNSVTSSAFGTVTSTLNSPRDLQFAFKVKF